MKMQGVVREKMNALKFYSNHLSRMMMPNLSIFIAWMIISFFLTQLNIEPIYMKKVEAGFLQLILPLMVAYTGGEFHSRGRGGIAAVVAVFGLILMTDAPQVFGAMALGPTAGWLVKRLDQIMNDKVQSGYEMITANVSVGVVGGLLFLVSYFLLAPLFEEISQAGYQVVDFFVRNKFFAGIHLILEPMKVFFFNNIINHGLLTPLGIEDAAIHGSSLLFLIETNPGPGMGLLAAFCWLGPKQLRSNAATALVVQTLGGIHEVYFPFVLLHPALFIAPIIGGISGTLVFQLFDAGLKAPASPGSLLIIMANAPLTKLLGVLAGITMSAIVSFSVASVFLQRTKKNREVKNMSSRKLTTEIVVACDAGMGSSAIGASMLTRQLQEAQLSIPVRYESIYRVDDRANILLVTQKEMAAIARKKAPHAQHFYVENFLALEEYTQLINQIKKGGYLEFESFIPQSIDTVPLVFLYKGTVRGSQTMAIELIKKLALEIGMSVQVSKAPLENISFENDTVYVISEELAKKVVAEAEDVRFFVVKDILQIEQYRQLLTEGVDYVPNQT